MASSKIDIWNRAARLMGVSQRIESADEGTPQADALDACHDDILKEVLEAREWPWAVCQRPLTEIAEQVQTYAGDAATTVFAIPYDIGDASELTVTTTTGGAVTTKTLGTDYTLTLASEGTPARVTMTAAPGVGTTLTLTVATERVGWEYVYALPTDVVTPLALLSEDQRRALTDVEDRIEFAVMQNNARTGKILCCNVGPDDFEVLEYIGLITYVPQYSGHFITALAHRLAVELVAPLKKDAREADYWMAKYKELVGEAHARAKAVGHEAEPETPGLSARG